MNINRYDNLPKLFYTIKNWYTWREKVDSLNLLSPSEKRIADRIEKDMKLLSESFRK